MRKNLPIIIAVLGVLVVIALFAYVFSSKSSPFGRLERIFDNTTTDLDSIGGILCNNFGPQWFQDMLRRGEVSLQDTSVCAHVNRHTCTAYSYVRRDLIPMLFTYPGVGANVPCGIILDTKKVWPLITLMAIVDGDTNSRSCCTNETGGAILTRSPWSGNPNDFCIYNSMRIQANEGIIPTKWVSGNYAVFIPVKDSGATGGTCDTSCVGDKTCMYNNSGGNINQWLMNSSQECIDGKYANCYTFTLVDDSEVPQSMKNMVQPKPDGWLKQGMASTCKTCKKPYLCVFSDAPQAKGGTASSEDKYKVVEEADRFASYIGPDGRGMQITTTNTMNLGTVAISQCRFEKKDWNLWLNVLKQNYKNILGLVRFDNSMVESFNYQLANPDSPSYFENEVNLYIDPDTSSEEYERQNKIWQDSILGFYYIASTCEEQLAPLEGIRSNAGGNIVTGTLDRCNEFFGMATNNRRQWEKNRINMSRKLVHQVADLFNKNHGRDVPVYKCTADSNAFPNYQSLLTAADGDVKLSSMFQPDTDFEG